MKLLSTYRPTVPAVATQDTARAEAPAVARVVPTAPPAAGRPRDLQHQPRLNSTSA